jgi:hypothetical protein
MVNAWEIAKISESAWNDLVRIAIRDGKVKIDDIAEMYFNKIGSNPSYSVLQTLKDTVTKEMSLPGRIAAESKVVAASVVSLGEKAGSAVSKKVVPFVTTHPTLSAGVASAIAGGLVVAAIGAGQGQGLVTVPADPYAFNTPYDPNNVVLNPGSVTSGVTPTVTPKNADGTEKKDYGIIGNGLAWVGTTLFGQTGEEIGNFVDGAKPWVVGAGVIAGVVALGYTVNSIRGNKQTIRFDTGMSHTRH